MIAAITTRIAGRTKLAYTRRKSGGVYVIKKDSASNLIIIRWLPREET